MQLFLDSYGKFGDWAARWLSERIPPAPFLTNRAGELISAEEAGVEFCEVTGRFNNHRRWSSHFPYDMPTSGGFEWIRHKK